ncbi:MAG: BON domain-containing protein [Acidimicrobiales bacterium]
MASPTPVGDDNDVAFAAMAGVAVIVAVVVAVILPLRAIPTVTTSAVAASQSTLAPTAANPPTTEPSTPDGSGASDTGSGPTAPTLAPGPTEAEVLDRLTSAGFPALTVMVDDHTVTVSGDLPDDALRRAALGVVQSIDGVGAIIDEIRVR